eukprot:scaffold678180_cov57-Prasinocladus_malaysianus.AAC.1
MSFLVPPCPDDTNYTWPEIGLMSYISVGDHKHVVSAIKPLTSARRVHDLLCIVEIQFKGAHLGLFISDV